MSVFWSSDGSGQRAFPSTPYEPMAFDRNALESAAMASLYSDARADVDADIDGGDRRGWWADPAEGDRFGSEIWTLYRQPVTDETAALVQQYAAESLDWMLVQGVATRVAVLAQRTDTGTIALAIGIERNEGAPVELTFDDLWGELYA